MQQNQWRKLSERDFRGVPRRWGWSSPATRARKYPFLPGTPAPGPRFYLCVFLRFEAHFPCSVQVLRKETAFWLHSWQGSCIKCFSLDRGAAVIRLKKRKGKENQEDRKKSNGNTEGIYLEDSQGVETNFLKTQQEKIKREGRNK